MAVLSGPVTNSDKLMGINNFSVVFFPVTAANTVNTAIASLNLASQIDCLQKIRENMSRFL